MFNYTDVIKDEIVPYPFQKEGIRYLLKYQYFFLGSDMGTGKSFQAIAAALMIGKRILVVCPAYLKWNWKMEFKKFQKAHNTDIAIIDEAPSINSEYAIATADVVIINYDKLMKYTYLLDGFPTVIVDEAQYLKNLKAKRTETFHEAIIKYKPENLFLLSGTAIKNKIPEFYSTICLMCYNPSGCRGKNLAVDFTYWSFCCRYSNHQVKIINNRRIQSFTGMRNLLEFKTYLEGKYFRHSSSELKDLPDMSYRDIIVDYGEDDELWDAFNKVNAMGSGIIAKTKSAIAKAKFTVQYVKDLMDKVDSPIVIYTDHRRPIEIFEEEFKKNIKTITGDTNAKTRQQIIEDFQEGKVPILAATIGAASTGITITRSQNIVFNDLSWVPADNMQAEKRIHRIGQTGRCTIHRIIGSKVDHHIIKLLEEKMKLLREVL